MSDGADVLEANATTSMYAIPPGPSVLGNTPLPERVPPELLVMLKLAQLGLLAGSSVRTPQ